MQIYFPRARSFPYFFTAARGLWPRATALRRFLDLGVKADHQRRLGPGKAKSLNLGSLLKSAGERQHLRNGPNLTMPAPIPHWLRYETYTGKPNYLSCVRAILIL